MTQRRILYPLAALAALVHITHAALSTPAEGVLNGVAATANLKFGGRIDINDASSPLNGTITCFLDTEKHTVVGVSVNAQPATCESTPTVQTVTIAAPVTAVSVQRQKMGPGVAALRFASAVGTGLCGFADKAYAQPVAITGRSKGRVLASLAGSCFDAQGRTQLAAGGLALTFTSVGAPGGSASGSGGGGGGGGGGFHNPFTPMTLQADGPQGPPTTVPDGGPPNSPSDPVLQEAAVSWLGSVVAGSDDLTAAVATAPASTPPDFVPPYVGESAYTVDGDVILSSAPRQALSPQAAANLTLGNVTSVGGVASNAAGDATPDAAGVNVGGADVPEAPTQPSTSATLKPSKYANGLAGAPYSDSLLAGYTDAANRTGVLWACRAASGNTCVWWSRCTASLIGKSLLVTAAHCVFSYGARESGMPVTLTVNGAPQLQVFFDPGYGPTANTLGVWAANDILVPGSYFAGTDTCDGGGRGIVCNNDVALVWLKSGGSTNQQAGVRLGYNAYGYNNYGMTAPPWWAPWWQQVFGWTPMAMVTQLGYPTNLEGGINKIISQAPAMRYYIPWWWSTTGATVLNLMRGTAMASGSSGGPWIVNYGTDAASGDYGYNAVRNVIVGVTSWGYGDGSVKTASASVFGQNAEYPGTYGVRGAGNIGFLVDWACDADGGWKLQSKGMCTDAAVSGVGK